MKKIKYGIAGCGGHALRAHALPGKNIPELELVGVFDVNPGHLAHLCKEFGGGLTSYGGIEHLLASDIDAMLIASPDEFHIRQLKLALEAGKHVLVEKPLAVNGSDLEELKSLLVMADERKLVVTTCHLRRFDPPFIWLKRNLPDFQESLGGILKFDFDFSYHRPESKWKMNRSLLLDHLNHEVDLMHFFLGIAPFEASLGHDSFDRYLVTGMRGDGVAFSFHGSRRLEARVFLEMLTVRFEKGLLILDTHSGVTKVEFHETGVFLRYGSGKTDYEARSIGVMQNFAGAILGQTANYLTPEDLWVNNWLGVQLLETGKASYDM